MNRLFLMRKPYLFQGEKYLNKGKNYFEGWYFKNTSENNTISFIPGISIDNKNKKAFIQVINNTKSYFIDYSIDSFKFSHNPFEIQIGDNIFSQRGIHIDIKDNNQNLKIYGSIDYEKSKNIATNLISPNIMGPFSYIPAMECNHAILSMKNKARGLIYFNEDMIIFNDGIGYIEKDWGCSFPKSYIWCQGNNFEKSDSSFMISIADIPFGILNFKGIICVLIINNKEFRFTTYNNTKILEYNVNDKFINIKLKKQNYTIYIKSEYTMAKNLVAPVKGQMSKNILESISAKVDIILKKGTTTIFSDTSKDCGLEIV